MKKSSWEKNLALMAGVVRQDQKNKKTPKNKHDLKENFRGRKGFNDTGIALTPKTIKEQRKNKLNYNKTRYVGSRLNIINDARAEAARKRRLDNPKHKKRTDAIIEIADERIARKDDRERYQIKLDNMRSQDPGSSIKIGNNKNVYYDGGAPVDDGSVELDPYAVDAACRSVIDQYPKFRNKVEEEIYRLKNNR
jgi:hypothetical protein|tara:strand:- start:188 stop:769 length:582 start_codon:yes stop_codon:yes gene_type:complete